jgi:Fic family protein
MAATTKKHEFELIRSFLRGQSNGATSTELGAALQIERRTLLRRLKELEAQGLIISLGKSRGTRYYSVPNKTKPEVQVFQEPAISLSTEGAEVFAAVSQPLQRRRPVAYNLDFLRSYRPNVDFYLSDNELKKLAELGNTSKMTEPAGTYAGQILHRLLIDLSWNSSRLEGNTYSLLDTERLISAGEEAFRGF